MTEFYRPEKPSRTAFPIADAGYPFIFASAFTTGVLALLGFALWAIIALLTTFFICYFFRDPDRLVPLQPGVVVSPADGKIIDVKNIADSRYFNGRCVKVSIFMSVFNVHVNRIPHGGEVKKIDYQPGKFFSANLDKASEKNEHNAVYIELEDGHTMCMVQIAGLIARRIICHIQNGDRVVRGQRFGMICFGSRVDLYLPVDIELDVSRGDKVKAGASIVGHWS